MLDGFSEREIVYRAEDLILRLRDVRSCRIATDETGAISEVHVVASSDRSPKMIARDVETALKAELGLQIDYRKIGVVIMEADRRETAETPGDRPFLEPSGEPEFTDSMVDERFVEADANPVEEPAPSLESVFEVPPPFFEEPEETVEPSTSDKSPKLEFLEDSTRIVFRGFNLRLDGGMIEAEVRLSAGELEVAGSCREMQGCRPAFESIADAAANALMELLDETFQLCLSEVKEFEIADQTAIVAVVDVIRGRDSSRYTGCAFVGRDSGEAAVMAVLDAVNRPFGRWKTRREIHYRIR